MAERIEVALREHLGKHSSRRLRAAGSIPAVLYGHGQAAVNLAVPADGIAAAIRHGSRLIELTGAVREKAFIRELQWDTWGMDVLHIDFTRVREHERVQVQVRLELRGEAQGLRKGGVIEQPTHEVEIECEATDVTDRLEVNVNHLELGGSIRLADLELPPGAKILDDPETTVVQCVEPVEEVEEEEAAAEAEPEVIGRKPEEESEEGE